MKAIIIFIAILLFILNPKLVFAENLLLNSGFEDGISNWSKYGGTLGTSSSIVNSGTVSATLTSTTSSTKWIYQVVSVTGGTFYSFSGYVQKNDSNISSILLRTSWYSSADGGGSELSHTDSTATLTDNNSSFQLLSTGSVVVPDDANSARAKAVVAFSSTSQTIAYFDDFVFQQVPSPTPTPTPTLTPTPTSTPAPTATPTMTPTLIPTKAPTLIPSPTAKSAIISQAELPPQVLGENTKNGIAIPPPDINSSGNDLMPNDIKKPDNTFQKIVLFLGIFIAAIACGIVAFNKFRKGNEGSEENEEG